MKLTEAMKKLPTKEVLGKLCWSPATCAKVIGVNRNTILNWIRKTKDGEMDMPFLGGKVKGSPAFIPVREFLDWYGYAGQN